MAEPRRNMVVGSGAEAVGVEGPLKSYDISIFELPAPAPCPSNPPIFPPVALLVAILVALLLVVLDAGVVLLWPPLPALAELPPPPPPPCLPKA